MKELFIDATDLHEVHWHLKRQMLSTKIAFLVEYDQCSVTPYARTPLQAVRWSPYLFKS